MNLNVSSPNSIPRSFCGVVNLVNVDNNCRYTSVCARFNGQNLNSHIFKQSPFIFSVSRLFKGVLMLSLFSLYIGELSLDEFVDGARRDKWVMKMLQMDVNPGEWINEQRRRSANF